jgi:hypothetical protein
MKSHILKSMEVKMISWTIYMIMGIIIVISSVKQRGAQVIITIQILY